MNLLYDPATLPSEPNPLARKVGVLAGKTCKTCWWLRRLEYHNKHYYKCMKRGIKHSAANDHRLKWHACALYEANNAPHGAGRNYGNLL